MFESFFHFRRLLRIQLNPKENVQQFAHRVAKLWEHCSEHTHFPLLKIIETFDLPPATYLNISYDFHTTENNGHATTEFDLALSIKYDEDSKRILVTFRGSSQLFNLTTIDDVVQRFEILCQQLLCSSFDIQNQPIYELSILLPSEHKMLEKLNNNLNPTKITTCIHQAFIEQAILYPNKLALILDDQSVTYSELLAQTQQLALILVNEKGIQPGDIICQYLDRSIEMIIGMMSILMAGAIYTPLNTSDSLERLQAVVEQVKPKLILVNKKSSSIVNSFNFSIFDIAQLNDVDNDNMLIEQLSQVNVTPESISHIIFTSGSTGVPKCVQIHHRNIIAYMKIHVVQQSDIVLQLTGPSFDSHLEEIFGALIRGAQLIILKSSGHLDFDYISRTIHETKVTYVGPVPSWLNALGKYLQENVHAQHRVKSIQCVYFGGKEKCVLF